MPDLGATRFEGNLSLLSVRHPSLAERLRSCAPDPRIVFLESRRGETVPALRSGTEPVPLHSLYDARRESRRAAEQYRGAGCVVACGLGAGLHLEPLLEQKELRCLFLIEKDAAVLRALFERLDFSRLLADPRLTVVAGTGGIHAALASAWKPALMGAMRTLPLRSWCDREREFASEAHRAIEAAVDSIQGDFSVQAHFGKRWFCNILGNLPRVARWPAPPPVGHALVAAAGPTFDDQAARLVQRREKVFLLAADTLLPALLRRGLAPDAVLSIDCQVYGYYHFLQGLPDRTDLYLDLACPPFMARRFPRARFVCGGHPLARYLERHWMALPRIDTSGGNVAHAAVTLARAIGAATIEVLGADFSYPLAKPYARGTYLYDYFQSRQTRLDPEGSALISLALQNASREVWQGRSVLTTAVLSGYARRFSQLAATLGPGVRREGPALPGSSNGPAMPGNPDFSWPAPSAERPRQWRQFLRGYARTLEALRDLPPGGALDEAWETLLPVAASLVKEGFPAGSEAMQEARRWSMRMARRALEADRGDPPEGPDSGASPQRS